MPELNQTSARMNKSIIASGIVSLLLVEFFAPAAETSAPVVSAQATATVVVRASQRYKVAVCDWMILKRQKLGAFQLTKDIGADGVEVDMGSLGQRDTFENQLTNADACRPFLDK